ncbi:aminotransferase class I/II-fold pyridoxal phosphate-dependent enzyme [Mesohalobacter halotolerans]|uniref:Pyridoxal phosphate-dependent aminotransferase family protein n=1 Tax=Mesohalobacter halotolerans TaxID=1883405 RepID=A0A4U5TT60_9FLAO|nr:pyridoxal phosphate-dependent aminotransferase family protein [Mesohalobacter halotolerans]TKS57547.1 pyridoxal phosphate-dependent aminotransferase family protein [Mesohalobacter halotolerans]
MEFPSNLSNLLRDRKNKDNFRELKHYNFKVDFLSNDYLGYAQNSSIYKQYLSIIKEHNINKLGSTGSRLINGNHSLFQRVERKAEDIFNTDAALFFNSGYNANVGLLSAVLRPKDLVFYDELCHASIRDGLQMASAKAYKFKHCDFKDLEQKIRSQVERLQPQHIYIVTESVFSMDGDTSDISNLIEISGKYKAHLIIDEAHAVGVCGENYKGLTQNKDHKIFARILTCGKSLGSHGAFVLGSQQLKSYMINFCKSFIYTTAASPHQVASVLASLHYFESEKKEKTELQTVISNFTKEIEKHNLQSRFIPSQTAIQSFLISGNTKAKQLATTLQQKGFGVKAILHPTVPKGKERIRICLHSFNTEKEIINIIKTLKTSA